MSKIASTLCQNFSLQMWLWLSGELPENKQQFWQRHVQSCPRCQELLATAHAIQEQYGRLPQYEAPERVIRTLTRQTQAPPRAGRLSRLQPRFSTLAALLDFRPRRTLVGIALAGLLFIAFHYLAFRPRVQHTWEAIAFDQKLSELSSVLHVYNQEVSELDRQLDDLNFRLAVLADELENVERQERYPFFPNFIIE